MADKRAVPRKSRPKPLATEIDPQIAEEIRRGRHQYFRNTIDVVVDHAIAYSRELERDDAAHRARLSSRWHKLFQAILDSAEAYHNQQGPITLADVDMHMRIRSLGDGND